MSAKEMTKKDAPAGQAGLTRLAIATPAEQFAALQQLLGGNAGELEVILAGKLPFWPAVAGAVLVGTIQSRREVPTRFATPDNPKGLVGIYTILVQDREAVAGTADGEVTSVKPGEMIILLERSVMKEFQDRIGQKVAILNLGKKMSKTSGFEYWDYRAVGTRRATATELAAKAMAASSNGDQ